MGHFETFCFHCPPMMGALTMPDTAGVPGPKFGFFVQSRLPTGVSPVSVFIASTIFCLFFGSPLAFSPAAATSNRDRLAPSCWFHCLPLDVSYPLARSADEMPVSDDL